VARTPLLQFLKTLSSNVRFYEGRDIAIADMIAERAAPSRRQFVAGASAVATSALVPEAAFAAASNARIAIVGGGSPG
jgi:hypothetical protein